jgi:hypothetical protein
MNTVPYPALVSDTYANEVSYGAGKFGRDEWESRKMTWE